MRELDGHLTLDGCTLRFSDSGAPRSFAAPESATHAAASGTRPVLLLHGAGVDHSIFAQQAMALEDAGVRVVFLDLRGHGRSRPNAVALTPERLVRDVEALVAHLHLGRVSLVGHSLGGNLAQELVRRAPERYERLAVLDSTWNVGPLRASERLGLRLASPMLRMIPAGSLPKLLADASATTPGARAELRRRFAAMTKREFLSAWRATAAFVRPAAQPSRTPLPLLLVRGADDRTGNIASAMPAWSRAEGVKEHVVPGAGHVVTLDAPGAVSALLIEFILGR